MQTSRRPESESIAAPLAREQAWLSSPGWDMVWIISPAIISSALVLLFREQMLAYENTPLWVWVCFILLVDVAHVYGTLFRTYLSARAFSKNKATLIAIPALAWVGGSLLYAIDGLYFWRVLAYLAVFHFIRQQFGFMVLYSRKEPAAWKRFQFIDAGAIYMATIYPLLYWHTHVRNFSWFVAGDFFSSLPVVVEQAGFVIYLGALFAYLVKACLAARQGYINFPKHLLLLATALSWWAGIIAVNSDMAFTITNVVSHGIPYMALIWLYHGSKAISPASQPGGNVPPPESPAKLSLSGLERWPAMIMSSALLFFVFLALLAYLEEGFWDGLLWREHLSLFAPFSHLPQIGDPALLALLVPFLALPQSTHYILDGFIWRVKERNNIWST